MRTQSPVFTAIQAPMTLFGLPPRAFALAVGAEVAGCFVFLPFLGASITIPALFLMIAVTILWLRKAVQRDPHFEALYLDAPRFWQIPLRGRWRRFNRDKNHRSLLMGRPR